MKKLNILLSLCLLLCVSAVHAQSSNDTTTAKTFLMLQQTGQFEKAHALLDTLATKTVSAAQLKKAWEEQLVARHGKFIAAHFTSQKEELGYNAVYEKCTFEKNVVDLRVVFSKSHKILGYVVAGITPVAGSGTAK
ncbi:DUF3887 domain-containing protein [Chitinophaga agrisoli]|uniref:DUF3887 domain-containing protein n=1 Tax=Chitinophaga agrisoli TaxID=2607653 RepID=A0A5B2VIY5_9BACT|nr:DUF3887 domain-containing protein [Chitinophaga agrisoli]KAA2238628.1 DUF3887 domain-containing protein [Chitinophaga agrisoli]